MNMVKHTRQKGKGVRDYYKARKYKKGTQWWTGNSKSLRKRGLAFVEVKVIDTYKTYSRSGYTNWSIHVEVLSGEKKGKEYRLSNVSLYTLEELT